MPGWQQQRVPHEAAARREGPSRACQSRRARQPGTRRWDSSRAIPLLAICSDKSIMAPLLCVSELCVSETRPQALSMPVEQYQDYWRKWLYKQLSAEAAGVGEACVPASLAGVRGYPGRHWVANYAYSRVVLGPGQEPVQRSSGRRIAVLFAEHSCCCFPCGRMPIILLRERPPTVVASHGELWLETQPGPESDLCIRARPAM